MQGAGHPRAAPNHAKPRVEVGPNGNLPAQLTPLIGREREIATARGILGRTDVRLLTLTGPGGVGKTRLALRVAAELADDFADGICFVSLAPVREPRLVVPTIAQASGVREVGERSLLDRLKSHLREKRLLLVLDNFEHVTEAAPAVTRLLEACPRLKVLATSREALHLSAEHEYAVPSLGLPDPGCLPEPQSLSRYDAVALFLERARAVKPDFALTEANAQAVAEICARLDGLPLAIKLAAARVKLLPPRALLARLERRLQLLTGGALDSPTKEQTMRGAIGWGYDLLRTDEKRMFERLSVFVGGCTLGATESVCGAPDDPETLNTTGTLVDKSLLRQEEQDDGEPRLAMLETIREYALERLAESGEEETVRRAHAGYYLALAEEVEPRLTTAEQLPWLERLEAEHANLRAALSWSLRRKDSAMALRLCGALWRFWYLRSYLGEGRRWLEEALALDGGPTALRARALNGAGHLAWGQGDLERATELREESLKLFRRLGDRVGIAASLNGLSFVLRMRGDYATAGAMCEEALAMHRELGDTWGTAQSLFLLGATAAFRGDHASACPLLEESVALYREIGERQGLADALGVLGMASLSQGRHARARSLAEESREIMGSLGYRRGVAKALGVLGDVALDRGEYDTARDLYEESLGILGEMDDRWWMAWCLEGLAGVAAAQRQPIRAARLFGATEALRERIGGPRPAAHQAAYERRVAAARSKVAGEAFEAAWAAGRNSTPEQALAVEEPQPGPAATPGPAGLTAREAEVLALVAGGMNNVRVAEKLFISPRTVDAHLRSIYGKLEVNSRTAAARYAADNGLV